MEKTKTFTTDFAKSSESMIATNDRAYNTTTYFGERTFKPNYTADEIERIIEDGNIDEQIKLSRFYFKKDGLYRRIVTFYATLIKYTGLLIPNVKGTATLNQDFVIKRYNWALDFCDSEKVGLKNFYYECALRAVRDGCYYGIISELTKDKFVVINLPADFCRTRFKDEEGRDIVEFNVTYFTSIVRADKRKQALKTFPKEVRNYYNRFKNGKVDTPWMFISNGVGLCFPLLDGYPMFLSTIPETIDYDEAVKIDRERDLEEIKKIIVQKIPHFQDGGLLFEPEEARVIHQGTVGMMKGNKNVSVLTTYADVDAIVSKTQNEATVQSIERALANVYAEAGVSSQLFGTDSNLALSTSIKNDLALMMTFVHKIEKFITIMLNELFGNSNISFTYKILPITYYNDTEFMDSTYKLATSGYSFLLPALASGLSQKELSNVKDLENTLMGLKDKLIPLSSSYTESSDNGSTDSSEDDITKLEQTSPKTIQNQESMDNNGG